MSKSPPKCDAKDFLELFLVDPSETHCRISKLNSSYASIQEITNTNLYYCTNYIEKEALEN